MQLPGLPVQGMSEPLRVNIDFDAGVVTRRLSAYWSCAPRCCAPRLERNDTNAVSLLDAHTPVPG
jgi:hypothetical protein